MIIFNDNTIHGDGFKHLNSIGNYRIQLHIYDKYPHYVSTKNVYYKHYIYSNVTKTRLDIYRFEDVKRNIFLHKILTLTLHHHHIRNQEFKNQIQNHHRQQFLQDM